MNSHTLIWYHALPVSDEFSSDIAQSPVAASLVSETILHATALSAFFRCAGILIWPLALPIFVQAKDSNQLR